MVAMATCTVDRDSLSHWGGWLNSHVNDAFFSNLMTWAQLFKTVDVVNVLIKFQKLISEKCQNFLLKKCEKLFHCKSISHFFNKNMCIWFNIKS